MPSASAAWRVAISSAFISLRLGAELGGEAQLGVIGGDADAHQQVEVGRDDAFGLVVARTIFSSSSIVSSEKVRTPCVK